MANPSHSTAVPDRRNPDTSLNSQPVTPAKAGVHVDAGLDSGFRRNDGGVNGNDGGGGNPEQTSNSVRPEVLSLSKGEGPNGRSGFDELSPNGILNCRTLLT
ncbi:MAG: hypothetical protein MI755_19650, partial [Sphingomonadales bacterium]|nr:hypothetical protein [Sphingomonadales bacterium]